MQKEILTVSVDNVEPNDWNPNVMGLAEYVALMASVEEGEYDPIIVSPFEFFYGDTKKKLGVNADYVIVDGEHRWKAAVEVGLKEVNIEVKEITEDDAKPLNYKRNRQRGHMDPLREAELFKSEMDKPGMTQQVVADRYNISRQLVVARLSLLKLDETTVKLYTEPVEAYKELVEKSHKAEVDEFEQRIEKMKEEGMDEQRIEQIREYQKPDELDEEDLSPRGALTTSHIELIATLPLEEQTRVSAEVLNRGYSVRQTEREVQDVKNRLEQERKLVEALETAKRIKCPKCGADPAGFPNYAPGRVEDYFRCSECGHVYDHTKSQEEVDEEKRIEADKKKEAAKEAKKDRPKTIANPNHVRRLETPTELSDKVKPWIVKKLGTIIRIKDIDLEGYRLNPETGEEELISLEFKEARTDSANVSSGLEMRMTISKIMTDTPDYHHSTRVGSFGFTVEGKDYKRTSDKSRINLSWGTEVSPAGRAVMNAFFNETVDGDKDPWWCLEDIKKLEQAPVDENEEEAIEKEDYEVDPVIDTRTGDPLSYEEAVRLEPLLNAFLSSGDETVKVEITNTLIEDWPHDNEDTVALLLYLIADKGLDVLAYIADDECVYLEKPPAYRSEETDVTRSLLGQTVKDLNWDAALDKATVDDINYLLQHDIRKTAIIKYRRKLAELEKPEPEGDA